MNVSSFEEAIKQVEESLENLTNTAQNGSNEELNDNFGDILFWIVNLSRFLQLNAENSLTNATNKFINRFVSIEQLARLEGKGLSDLSVDELSALWGRVK